MREHAGGPPCMDKIKPGGTGNGGSRAPTQTWDHLALPANLESPLENRSSRHPAGQHTLTLPHPFMKNMAQSLYAHRPATCHYPILGIWAGSRCVFSTAHVRSHPGLEGWAKGQKLARGSSCWPPLLANRATALGKTRKEEK